VVGENGEAARAAGLHDDEIGEVGAIAALFAASNRLAHLTALRPNADIYQLGRPRLTP
jgi:alkylhydroperoxidase family enzyme